MQRGNRVFAPRTICIQLFALSYFLVSANQAYAYVDPGTAGMAIQALLATIAAGTATIAVFWQQIRAKVSGLFGDKTDADKADQAE